MAVIGQIGMAGLPWGASGMIAALGPGRCLAARGNLAREVAGS
jgi:hypothetical protein